MTREKLICEMDEKLRMPGVTNIWTQPIINRIEMLATGIRTQVGIKIFGNDLKELEEIFATGRRDSSRQFPVRRTFIPKQISGSPYIDIKIDRQAAARYGIDVGDHPGHDRKGHRRNQSVGDDRRTPAISDPGAVRVGVSRFARCDRTDPDRRARTERLCHCRDSCQHYAPSRARR